MLEHIFGSKTRLKILNLFFKDPKSKYYLRQIARETNSQLNAVRREIDNLVHFGIIMPAKDMKKEMLDPEISIIKNQKDSLKKYLQVNTSFVLFHELKALLLKSKILIEDDFVAKIQKIPHIELLVLSGIFVGREDAKSDMLLVGTIDKKKLMPIIDKFEKALGQNIRYTLMSASEYKYRREVTDKFLYDILENKNIIILDKVATEAREEKK